MSWLSSTHKAFLALLIVALFAAACGEDSGDGDTSSDSDADPESVSRAQGTLGDPNFTVIVDELASGLGSIGQSTERTLQGLADGGAVCSERAGPRANPRPSQIEVEIISVDDGCLAFTYGVAEFRSFVQDLRTFDQGQGVLAVSPMLLDYRIDQIESDWSTDLIDATSLAVAADAPTGQGTTIAIIDSGIDIDHPSLVDATITRVPDSGEGDYVSNRHGTLAAAVIAGRINDAPRPIAPATQLLDVPADLCGPDECGCDPCAQMTPAEAIRWSVDNGADILSMSFGYVPTPKPAWWELLLDEGEIDRAKATIEVALAYARFKNVAMAAAAGNCAAGTSDRCATPDQFEIPAGHRGVIGVGAVAVDDEGTPEPAAYSTRQDYVELAAPGSLRLTDDDGIASIRQGTSYATPLVAAALALLVGDDGPLAGRDDRGETARQILTTSALDLEPVGRDTSVGHGMLQLDSAVTAGETWAAANPQLDPPPGTDAGQEDEPASQNEVQDE